MAEKKKKIINVKRIALVTTVVAICLFLLGGSTYIMMKWIAEKVSKAAKQYTHTVSINPDGTFSTGTTAEELWQSMKESGYEIDKYLSGPEELEILMNAELVTQLPDTRSNVDELIDWDALLDGTLSAPGGSAQWAVDSPEYVNHLKNKLLAYDEKGGNYTSRTNLSILIDNDNCRLSIFEKSGDTYKLIAGWNCYCGYNGINTKHVNKGGAWGTRVSSHRGPRTLSQKGVYHVASKVYSDRTCFVTFNHGSRNPDGSLYCQCQQIHPYEFSNMDADKDPVENRYMSAGCTEVTQERSQWIHDNCPEGTRVVVFDKYNPMPKYNERDEKSEIGTYSQDVNDSKYSSISEDVDKLYYKQYVTSGAKNIPRAVGACGYVAMTLCIKIVNGDYNQNTLTPDKFYQAGVKKYGYNALTLSGNKSGDLTRRIKKLATEQYGVKLQTLKASELSVARLKSILSAGGCLWTPRGKSATFIKPGGKTRKHTNGHTIMFYKYENGGFYAKDDARDGGPMIKYTETQMMNFVRGSNAVTAVFK